MIGAIVLAAGASTRMGRQKLLLPFGGATVIEHVVGELQRAGVSEIRVVTGHDHVGVVARLSVVGVTVVENPDYPEGMLSSVRTGLRDAPGTWSAALIALGDQPLLQAETVKLLMTAHAESPSMLVVPAYDGRRGHPLVLPSGYWGEVFSRYDDVGLRGVLRAHEESVREVPVSSSEVLSDMDYPDDYRAALAALRDREGRD